MKHLKPFILESKQIGYLYHFTSLYNGLRIIESMQLKSSEFYDDDTDKHISKVYKYRISFTRNPILWKTLTSTQKLHGALKFNIRLKFDGNKLSNNFKLKPHDDNFKIDNNSDIESFLKPKINKRSYDMGDEMEERLYTNEKFINIENMLIEYCCIFKNMTIYEEYKNGEFSQLDTMKNNCIEKNIKFKIIVGNETLENI